MYLIKTGTILVWFLLIQLAAYCQLNIEHYLGVGRTELFNDNYPAAIERFNAVIKVKPELFEAFFFRGFAKYNLGDYSGAMADFNKVAEINPYFADGYHFRGISRARLNDYNDAMLDFERSIELNPVNHHVFISQGTVFMMLERYDDAILSFNKSIQIKNNNPDAYINRGLAYFYKKEIQSAIDDFNKTIQLNPYFADAFARRGMAKAENKDLDGALSDYNHAIKLDAKNSLLFFNRALVKYHLKDIEGALADYNKVIEMDPKNGLTYFNRAILKSEIGDYNGAIKDYDMVTELNPGNVLPYYNRAAVYFELGNYFEAIEDYSNAIKIFPDFASAYMNRSAAKERLKDHKGAMADYNMAQLKIKEYKKNQNPDSAGINFMDTSLNFKKLIAFDTEFDMGYNPDIQLQYKNISIEPVGNYTFCLSTDKSSDPSLRKLQLKFPDVPEKFEKFNVKMAPDSGFVASDSIYSFWAEKIEKKGFETTKKHDYYFAALVNSQTGNFNKALHYSEMAVQTDTTFAFSYFNRANIRYKMIDFVFGMEDFNRTIRMDGNKSDYSSDQKVETVIPDLEKVVDDYSKAIELEPGFSYAYFNRANALCRMRNFTQAIDDYTKAVESDNDFAEAFYNRGLALIYLNEKEKGCADLSKSGELGISKAYNVIKRYCQEKK